MQNYVDFTLSDAIQTELLNYINNFKSSQQKIPPVLAFPVDMGRVMSKAVRYYAAIYNLAAFYVYSKGSRLLVVCHKDYLNNHYRNFYEGIFMLTNEDTEVIDYIGLHTSLVENSRSLLKTTFRRKLGLPIFRSSLESLEEVEENSEVDYSEGHQSGQGDATDNHSEISVDVYNSATEDLSAQVVADQIQGRDVEAITIIDDENTEPLTETVTSEYETVTSNVTACSYELNENVVEDILQEPEREVSLLEPTCLQLPSTSQKEQLFPVYSSSLRNTQNLNTDILKEYYDYSEGMVKYLREPPLIVNTNQNYDLFEYLKTSNLDNVVEVYDIPANFHTEDLEELCTVRPFKIKWCDNHHALIITTSLDDAQQILELKHPTCKTRGMVFGSPVATIVASLIDFPAIVTSMINE